MDRQNLVWSREKYAGYGAEDEELRHLITGTKWNQKAQQAVIDWEPVNSRIISATLNIWDKNIKFNAVQCYAPTNDASDGKKEEYFEQVQSLLNKLKAKDITILTATSILR